MTTSTIPLAVGTTATRARRLLVALTIVILLAVSFTIGHFTGSSQQPSVATPAQNHAQMRARIEMQAGTTASGRSSAAIYLGLTAREGEVLALLASGRTDGQIAEELFISKKTASVHVSNVLRKLGVANRIEAGAIGQELRQSELADALLT